MRPAGLELHTLGLEEGRQLTCPERGAKEALEEWVLNLQGYWGWDVQMIAQEPLVGGRRSRLAEDVVREEL